MPVHFAKPFYFATTALTLSLVSYTVHADPALPGLTNLNFAVTANPPKGYFTTVDPAGWTKGNGGNLIFIDSTTAPNAQAASNVYLTTYGNPTGGVTGNYVEADGNPTYESVFYTTVKGLNPGTTYTLSFYQGASEQKGFGVFGGQTTNQWIVSLGTQALMDTIVGGGGSGYGVYSNPDSGASTTASPLMTVLTGQTTGWNYVSVNLTADKTTDILSFLAWGDNGSTANLPPIAFLSGVDSPPGLGAPEPASLALFGVGLAGLGAITRRRRGKQSTSG